MEKAAILAQRLARLLPARQLGLAALLLGLPTLGVVTAFGIAPGTVIDSLPRAEISVEIPLGLEPIAETPAQRYTNQERVLRGDTVAGLFDRLRIADEPAMRFLRSDPVGRSIFRQLVPGRTLQAEVQGDGKLLALRYFVSASTVFEVLWDPVSGYAARERPSRAVPRTHYRSATIRSSLFAATDAAGIPDAVAMQLTRVFATDIDFHVDLRRGDTVSVIYEQMYEGGEWVGQGRILSAQFVNQGRVYHAVLFADEDGESAYYDLDGSNRAKAFMRSPVEYSRVSSGFGSRLHPIFRNWRAHTGVDFAAPKGTRVLAAADGHVVSAGWRNGYGNAVELRHGGSITTLYAHLAGFAPGVRAGARVRQADAIGFVGATGWATGPHLHYEFKIGGVHQDPMKVALPKATPVPPNLRARFNEEAEGTKARLALVSGVPTSRFE